MRSNLCLALFLLAANIGSAETTAVPPTFDVTAAERFAKLALACVHKEYPNKISHNLNSDADVAPPRKLTPAFYGCYDWHSSVHGHWLLARLVRTFPSAAFAASAREALQQSLTADNIAQEAAYLRGRDAPASNAPMGWHGCFNWLRNYGNGTIRKPARWRRTCVHWKTLHWNG